MNSFTFRGISLYYITGERYLFTSRSVLYTKWSAYTVIENETTSVKRLLQATDRRSLSTFGLIRLSIDFDSVFIRIGYKNAKKNRGVFASHLHKEIIKYLFTPRYFYYIIFFFMITYIYIATQERIKKEKTSFRLLKY